MDPFHGPVPAPVRRSRHATADFTGQDLPPPGGVEDTAKVAEICGLTMPSTHEGPVPGRRTIRGRHRAGTDESIIRIALEGERVTAQARVQALQAELSGVVADAEDANGDDEHDPEGPTIAFERARVTALLADAHSHLADFNEALARLDSGNYSICATCHRTIPKERLDALPACRTCVECAVVRRPAL
jgi:DnaK suppressor protein